MELGFLHGRAALDGFEVHSLVTYGDDVEAGAAAPAAPGAGE